MIGNQHCSMLKFTNFLVALEDVAGIDLGFYVF